MEQFILPAICAGAYLFFYLVLWSLVKAAIGLVDKELRAFPIPGPVNITLILLAALPVAWFLFLL